MSRITQADLEKYLFGCADILRNNVEASSYRDYIFPLLFFKRINDIIILNSTLLFCFL